MNEGPKVFPGAQLRGGPHDTRTFAEIAGSFARKYPIDLEPRQETLNRPLIVENAYPGWQPRFWPPAASYHAGRPPRHEDGGVRYPAVPSTVAEQVDEIVKATRAGCSITHVHPRDPKDTVATHDPDLYMQIMDQVFAQTDVITCPHTWRLRPGEPLDYITDTAHLLEKGGGNKYCQSAVVLWPPGDSYPTEYEKSVQDGIRFFQENHVRPFHKLRSSFNTRKMHRLLMETGIAKDEHPHILIHDMGHPNGWAMDMEPWAPLDLIVSLQTTRTRIPNSILGVYSGGRNWLIVTLMAIMIGVDVVRVGIEDYFWMYPHRDDIIAANMDCVNKIIDFCHLIGRPVAGVDAARTILGITRTS